MNTPAATRTVQRVIQSIPTSDGAGVKLRRSLGSTQFARLDPFLMLDEFSSFDSNDYIAGFPSHPHRGFETVTYILDGTFIHQDSHGGGGVITDGGTQWMTAGGGVLHIETPPEDMVVRGGLFHGIQATLFAQQIAARQQLEQMRQLPGGMPQGPPGEPNGPYL